jgi:hypothetical protein
MTCKHPFNQWSRAVTPGFKDVTSTDSNDKKLTETLPEPNLQSPPDKAPTQCECTIRDEIETVTGLFTHLPRAVDIATEYNGSWLHLEPRIQLAIAGFIEAFQRFDRASDWSFEPYRDYWGRAFIRSFLKNSAEYVQLLATPAGELLAALHDSTTRTLLAEGKSDDPHSVAAVIGVSPNAVEKFRRLFHIARIVREMPATTPSCPHRVMSMPSDEWFKDDAVGRFIRRLGGLVEGEKNNKNPDPGPGV